MAGEPYDTDRVLTLPNILSGMRLLGVPLFLWLVLVVEADAWAVLVLAVSSATDWLDGYLARSWHQTSRLGQILDPLADRLYILAALLGLGLREIVPWWLVAVIVARDVLMVVVIGPPLRRRGFVNLPVHFLGKAATFALLYAFPLVLLGAGSAQWQFVARVIGWAFVCWGVALYWWAALIYLRQAVGVSRQFPVIKQQAVDTAAPVREP